MSADGWVAVEKSNKTVQYRTFRVQTESRRFLLCADDHILIDEAGYEVFAKNAVGVRIQTLDGPEMVVSVEDTGYSEHMYDLSVSGAHLYFTNGFLSHNTTTNSAIILHFVLFNTHKNVAIIANRGKTSREILNRLKVAYEHLPKWMQQGIIEWNKGSISLENGCNVFADSSTASSIRGYTISLLFIDEVAFIQKNQYDEFFRSVFPTISSGKTTRIFMVSTPNGKNHFYRIVKDAKAKKNGFHCMEFDWRAVPGRTEKWKQDQIRTTGELSFRQEYGIEFIGASNTLVESKALEKLQTIEPIDISEDGCTRIFKRPEQGKTYFITSDVSEGIDSDYSTAIVLDITEIPFQQVATYRSNAVSPLYFPHILYALGKKYNDAFIMVERNNIGYSVVHDLNFDLNYDNVLAIKNDNSKENKTSLGIETTKTTKRLGCLRLKDQIESSSIELCDELLVEELDNFIQVKNSYAAADGFHDDLVMPLVNFAYYSTLPEFRSLTNQNFKRKFRELKSKIIEEDQAPPILVQMFGNESYDDLQNQQQTDEFMRWLAS